MSNASVDLIYLDPPFYTQRKQTLSGSDGKQYEFSDIWESRNDYLQYMGVRLKEMRRILKETGNLFLHCDTSAGHYLRVLLDEIFGEDNFRSEIIWSYKRWSNSRKGLLPCHQTIFYYSKTSHYKFHTMYGDYSPTTNIDQILQKRERNTEGKATYKRNANGEVVPSGEKKGVPLSDVWDIPFLNPKAKERTGYPTQKPIALLERIIEIGSDPGDIVLDPFCGSGTTLVSAELLGREYIGIDINPEAIELTKQRLDAPFKTTSHLLKVGMDAYQTKTEQELSILRQFDCDVVQRNRGIDAILKKHYFGGPVAIKIQRDNENFTESVKLLSVAGKKRNCSFTILLTHELDWEKERSAVPLNMVVITRYEKRFEQVINHLRLGKAL